MRTYRNRFALAAPLLALILLSGCRATEAKEAFARRFSCPSDKVEVRSRADLNYYDVHPRAMPRDEPPAEVKSDASRLAVWQEQRRGAMATKNGEAVYEVTGCGHTLLYSCTYSPSCHAGEETPARK